ncbi:MAG TPA: arginase [Candidatus Saccharimonadales bacterium]|nr:arginase [Candidatus Saccharimonadales bacterium]
MTLQHTTLNVLGAPLDLGAENLGVDMGPSAFRYQGLVQKLESTGLQVNDLGDVSCKPRTAVPVGNPKMRHLEEVVRVNEAIAAHTERLMDKGEKALVLGGDHSVCLGAVSGASTALAGNIGLIYFDAHGDMNTDETSLTGNIHGMHLASLMGFGAPELSHVHGKHIKVQPKHLLHIGGCDLDQAEVDLMRREKLATFTMFDLLSQGLGPLFPLIDTLTKQVDNIWVSLDLDAIDALYAPGAGMPNQKGLTYREIAAIAQYIGEHCNVVGVDVVEYNPLQDIERKTAGLATELIATFFGKQYSWYTQYLASNKPG